MKRPLTVRILAGIGVTACCSEATIEADTFSTRCGNTSYQPGLARG
jgi:hypothetical protein